MSKATKPVTLFGRKMRLASDGRRWHLGRWAIYTTGSGEFYGSDPGGEFMTSDWPTNHSAARALERKIVAQHKRLGRMIGRKP